MSDVSELVERCREPLTMSKFLRKDDLFARANEDRALAADALETLAGENAELRKDNDALDREWAGAIDILGPFETSAGDNLAKVSHAIVCRMVSAESRLAKLAPVVEAARKLTDADMGAFGDGADEVRHVRHGAFIALCHALATLEAAHD